MKKIGIIGARGYVGGELLRLLDDHDELEVEFVSSRALAGEKVSDHVDVGIDLAYEELTPDDVAGREADVWALALPNGLSGDWVEAIDASQSDAVIIDISADHRADDDWVYGLTEHHRDELLDARRIANPGCYATAANLALKPLESDLVGIPQIFGISGYSGAGTTPSEKNDRDNLADNIIPYKLTGHGHADEIGREIDRSVYFMPHVAPFFRGLTVTVSMQLNFDYSLTDVAQIYGETYHGDALVRFTTDVPTVQDVRERTHACVGGVHVGDYGRHIVVVSTLDNLLKGAASQALQNVNLACGFDEMTGFEV